MNAGVALPRIALALSAALCLAGCCRPSLAQEPPPSPEAVARDLSDEVLRKAGSEDLGAWTRDVIERALERAGEAATGPAEGTKGSSVPLPAERHAGRTGQGLVAARPDTAEVIVLLSFSVPAASWRQWARDAARTGAPLVLRGVGEAGLADTAKRIGARLGSAEAGVAIDPRLFRLFGIERVPTVVVVPGGVPPCRSRGCSDDPAPAHDRITGNIGLAAALEAVAAEGDAGRAVAKAHLERMNGDGR